MKPGIPYSVALILPCYFVFPQAAVLLASIAALALFLFRLPLVIINVSSGRYSMLRVRM